MSARLPRSAPRYPWWLLVAALAGCTRAGTSIVPIDVQLDDATLPAATLRIKSSFGGRTAEERFTCEAADCHPAVRLGLRLPPEASGRVDLAVERLDTSDNVLAAGTGAADVAPGEVSEAVAIKLSPVAPTNPGADAAFNDAAGEGGVDARSDRAEVVAPPDSGAGAPDIAADRPADLPAGTDASDASAVSDSRDVRDSAADAAAPDACVARPEDCFNAVDDDCDGMIDCADSDCQPAATCVPVAAGRALGAPIAAAVCPDHFTHPLNIYSGFSDARACSGCTCVGSAVCQTSVVTLGPGCTATGPPPSHMVRPGDACATAGSIGVSAFAVVTSSCAPASGTGQVTPPDWAETALFCEGMQGAGCGAGNVCLPRVSAASSACYLVAGSDTSVCAAPYTSHGIWYTGYAGDLTCACGCAPTAPASCGDATMITSTSGCPASGLLQGTVATVPGSTCAALGGLSYQSEGQATPPVCGVSTTVTGGQRTATGPQVLCCL